MWWGAVVDPTAAQTTCWRTYVPGLIWNMDASAMAAEERAGDELGGSSVSFVLGQPGASPPAPAASGLGAGALVGGGMLLLLLLAGLPFCVLKGGTSASSIWSPAAGEGSRALVP